ncbi:dentin sialophosphoprotein-like isoform X1 [Haliotis rufescens]|uniref:dentin sialophosphoprotein-like isoform X1 n=2 Tax=Haliotis rufescens TaxID=6454 RepID=UPI001EAFE0AA|nr:dentin sialophosphoprotein-like isoform X1 [Haliotis rufescens]
MPCTFLQCVTIQSFIKTAQTTTEMDPQVNKQQKSFQAQKYRKIKRVFAGLNGLYNLKTKALDFLVILREKDPNTYRQIKYSGTGELLERFEQGLPIFTEKTAKRMHHFPANDSEMDKAIKMFRPGKDSRLQSICVCNMKGKLIQKEPLSTGVAGKKSIPCGKKQEKQTFLSSAVPSPKKAKHGSKWQWRKAIDSDVEEDSDFSLNSDEDVDDDHDSDGWQHMFTDDDDAAPNALDSVVGQAIVNLGDENEVQTTDSTQPTVPNTTNSTASGTSQDNYNTDVVETVLTYTPSSTDPDTIVVSLAGKTVDLVSKQTSQSKPRSWLSKTLADSPKTPRKSRKASKLFEKGLGENLNDSKGRSAKRSNSNSRSRKEKSRERSLGHPTQSALVGNEKRRSPRKRLLDNEVSKQSDKSKEKKAPPKKIMVDSNYKAAVKRNKTTANYKDLIAKTATTTSTDDTPLDDTPLDDTPLDDILLEMECVEEDDNDACFSPPPSPPSDSDSDFNAPSHSEHTDKGTLSRSEWSKLVGHDDTATPSSSGQSKTNIDGGNTRPLSAEETKSIFGAESTTSSSFEQIKPMVFEVSAQPSSSEPSKPVIDNGSARPSSSEPSKPVIDNSSASPSNSEPSKPVIDNGSAGPSSSEPSKTVMDADSSRPADTERRKSTVQEIKDVMMMMNSFVSMQQSQFEDEIDRRERMHSDRMMVFKGLVDTLKLSMDKGET